jgi:predicted outer membrane protein
VGTRQGERSAHAYRQKRRAVHTNELDPEHKRLRDELSKASGKDFDVAYLASQIQEHQKTVMERLQTSKEQHMALTAPSEPGAASPQASPP